MSLYRHLNHTATITPRSATTTLDRYGDPVMATGRKQSWPCRLVQMNSNELPAGHDLTVSLFRLLLPPEAVIDAASDVMIDGQFYQVIGEPARKEDSVKVRLIHAIVRLAQ